MTTSDTKLRGAAQALLDNWDYDAEGLVSNVLIDDIRAALTEPVQPPNPTARDLALFKSGMCHGQPYTEEGVANHIARVNLDHPPLDLSALLAAERERCAVRLNAIANTEQLTADRIGEEIRAAGDFSGGILASRMNKADALAHGLRLAVAEIRALGSTS